MAKKVKIIYFICFSFIMGGFYNNETGWEYNQSTFQAFYMFESVTIDDLLSEGDGCISDMGEEGCYCQDNFNTCDVIVTLFP